MYLLLFDQFNTFLQNKSIRILKKQIFNYYIFNSGALNMLTAIRL